MDEDVFISEVVAVVPHLLFERQNTMWYGSDPIDCAGKLITGIFHNHKLPSSRKNTHDLVELTPLRCTQPILKLPFSREMERVKMRFLCLPHLSSSERRNFYKRVY